ncbi:hypothetical protein SUGI_0527080 [Cryptomeria japonica]|nr:hypothetical protein SUGI_0527080 [Cryptomeria japonica]
MGRARARAGGVRVSGRGCGEVGEDGDNEDEDDAFSPPPPAFVVSFLVGSSIIEGVKDETNEDARDAGVVGAEWKAYKGLKMCKSWSQCLCFYKRRLEGLDLKKEIFFSCCRRGGG